ARTRRGRVREQGVSRALGRLRVSAAIQGPGLTAAITGGSTATGIGAAVARGKLRRRGASSGGLTTRGHTGQAECQRLREKFRTSLALQPAADILIGLCPVCRIGPRLTASFSGYPRRSGVSERSPPDSTGGLDDRAELRPFKHVLHR